jgi:hypothetical protein
MKTTIEISDLLLDQAKRAAQEQGVSLSSIFERGLRMALQPHAKALKTNWPNLTFSPNDKGTLLSAEEWRDSVNSVQGWNAK